MSSTFCPILETQIIKYADDINIVIPMRRGFNLKSDILSEILGVDCRGMVRKEQFVFKQRQNKHIDVHK